MFNLCDNVETTPVVDSNYGSHEGHSYSIKTSFFLLSAKLSFRRSASTGTACRAPTSGIDSHQDSHDDLCGYSTHQLYETIK